MFGIFRAGAKVCSRRHCIGLLMALAVSAPAGASSEGGGSPVVSVTAPPPGICLSAGEVYQIEWTATDDTSVSQIDIFYRDGAAQPWIPLALGLANTGSHPWAVHNTPSIDARIRIIATDPFQNTGEGESGDFVILQELGSTVLTTLRDFQQPGTQPLEAGVNFQTVSNCQGCHGFYDPAAEPVFLFRGTMMHNSMRDPIFLAALAVAEQDAASSGDLCLRCHTPPGWLSGRSQPTDGSAMTEADRDGVSCHFCHRAVDPDYVAGVSPTEDVDILAAVDAPTEFGNGMYVVDTEDRRRGPFDDVAPPHQWIASPFHRESELCATCHNVSNPVFERVSGADYAAGPLDEPATDFSPENLMPVERTYSEWLASDYVYGVYEPDFAGNKADGIVSSCQDCHMSDIEAEGCSLGNAPTRPDMPRHDLTGGNAWVPTILDQIYPDEVDSDALAAAALRARAMLAKAAVLDVVAAPDGDSLVAIVTVTNRTGHKLPTGYPEGRRMWINLRAYDAGEQLVYESGAYDAGTGVLSHDEHVVIYEKELGISPAHGAAIGKPAGPSFHFVLNDSTYKDNRIPPRGFTNDAFDAFGGKPVDPNVPGIRYPDRQYWDTPRYPLPPSAELVVATLYYQTISKEYVEFLRDENATNTKGQELYDLWVANGRAAPVVMAVDSTDVFTVGAGELPTPLEPAALRVGANPFASTLRLHLDLDAATDVTLDVFDVRGRRVTRVPYGRLGGGPHRLVWDGLDTRGRDVGAGVFFARVEAGHALFVERVVRLR